MFNLSCHYTCYMPFAQSAYVQATSLPMHLHGLVFTLFQCFFTSFLCSIMLHTLIRSFEKGEGNSLISSQAFPPQPSPNLFSLLC